MRRARRLLRRETRQAERLFLAEGPQAVREALALPGCVVELFATAGALGRYHELSGAVTEQGVPLRLCDEDALAMVAGSVSPQGVVAVCHFLDVPLPSALSSRPSLVAVAAHVREPGNAGSLVRCADGAGAGAVVFAGSSVDPYNDKVVRASAGSIFHLPLVVATSVVEVVTSLRSAGFRVLAADAGGDTRLERLLVKDVLGGRVAWLFGNEARGLAAEERAAADAVVAVPIFGRAESLNVATAAAVCLYATAWSQRAAGQDGAPQPPPLSCS